MRLRCACPFRKRRQLLKNSHMLFAEGGGAGGKNFENPVDPAPARNRQNGNRAQTEAAADFHIHARVVLGIGAILNLAAAQTLP